MHWRSDRQSCWLTGNFLCKGRQCREAQCVLSNCIAGDIMIEHSPAKLIEACQSKYKLCSKCCSVAYGGGGRSHCTRVIQIRDYVSVGADRGLLQGSVHAKNQKDKSMSVLMFVLSLCIFPVIHLFQLFNCWSQGHRLCTFPWNFHVGLLIRATSAPWIEKTAENFLLLHSE